MSRKIDFQGLKNAELNILDAFISACRELELNYYVIGGTLLGAVRHKGFIPWDDDIDVGMFRKDYDFFIANAQEYLPSGMFLQTFETDRQYPMGFAKIRMDDTTFIETSVHSRKMHHGIYLDIFPIDFYPANRIRQTVWRVRERILGARLANSFDVQPARRSLKDSVICAVSRSFFKTEWCAHKYFEKCLKKEKQSSLVRNYFGAWGQKEIVPLEWYAEGATFLFEGREVRGPKEYDCYLAHVYGDYMVLPPPEKRVSHHHVDVFDLEKPYTEYV